MTIDQAIEHLTNLCETADQDEALQTLIKAITIQDAETIVLPVKWRVHFVNGVGSLVAEDPAPPQLPDHDDYKGWKSAGKDFTTIAGHAD